MFLLRRLGLNCLIHVDYFYSGFISFLSKVLVAFTFNGRTDISQVLLYILICIDNKSYGFGTT